MSKENLEIVRPIYAAWERGDFSSAEWAHPEIEYVIADGPTPGRWTGLAGLAEGWRSYLGAWEDFRAEAEDYLQIDNERILVSLRNTGRGRASGLDIAQVQGRSRGANLFQIRGGKVTRLVTYLDREHALEALGLPEDPGTGE